MKLLVINVYINLPSPIKRNDFQNLFNISKLVAKNKAIELEFLYYSKNWFIFDFSISRKTDHAGLNFEIGLFGYSIHFIFYDTRHWNTETDDYEIYDGYY